MRRTAMVAVTWAGIVCMAMGCGKAPTAVSTTRPTERPTTEPAVAGPTGMVLSGGYELTPVEAGAQPGVFEMTRMASLSPGTTGMKPRGVKAAPATAGAKGRFFEIECGKLKVWAMMVGEEAPMLYVDTDMDGDLAEEKGLMGSEVKREGIPEEMRIWDFGVVQVQPAGAKGAVEMRVTGYSSMLLITPGGMRRGEVKIGEKTCKLTVIDANMDGEYDGVMGEDRPTGTVGQPVKTDMVGIDWDGDGKWTSEEAGEKLTPLAKMMRTEDGRYWSMEVAKDGGSVRVKEAHPKMGTLEVKSPEGELTLSSANGMHTVRLPQGKCGLPVGKYYPVKVTLKKKDGEGHEWALRGAWQEAKAKAVEVTEEGTATLEVGPPLKAGTATQRMGDMIYVTLNLTGLAGEEYWGGALKDGKQTEAPTLQIVDKSGVKLTTGTFEYG